MNKSYDENKLDVKKYLEKIKESFVSKLSRFSKDYYKIQKIIKNIGELAYIDEKTALPFAEELAKNPAIYKKIKLSIGDAKVMAEDNLDIARNFAKIATKNLY